MISIPNGKSEIIFFIYEIPLLKIKYKTCDSIDSEGRLDDKKERHHLSSFSRVSTDG
jgi:hypothetical protein